MDKVKKILGALLLVVMGAFLFERSKRKSAEAIADNKEILDKVNEIDKEKAKNDGLLASEEEKRKEIKKDVEDEKANSSGTADELNKLLGK